MPQRFETFFGPWTISVSMGSVFHKGEQFRIEGSKGSDGDYSVRLSTVLPLVTGARWTITWMSLPNWYIREINKEARYTVNEGLVITVFPEVDDHYPFNSKVVCRSLDPAIDPISLPARPLAFELPQREPGGGGGGDRNDGLRPHGHSHSHGKSLGQHGGEAPRQQGGGRES